MYLISKKAFNPQAQKTMKNKGIYLLINPLVKPVQMAHFLLPFSSYRRARRQKLWLPERGEETSWYLVPGLLFSSKHEANSSLDTSCLKSTVSTRFVSVCAGRSWEAAEEASAQSYFPGWRSVLHQQETERRMAQPLEDGGAREAGICQCEFTSYIKIESFILFTQPNQSKVITCEHLSQDKLGSKAHCV